MPIQCQSSKSFRYENSFMENFAAKKQMIVFSNIVECLYGRSFLIWLLLFSLPHWTQTPVVWQIPPPTHQLAHWLQPILTWPQQQWQCRPTRTHSFLEEDIQLMEAAFLGEYVCCHVTTIYEMRQMRLRIELQKKTGKYLALSIWGGAWRLSNPEIRHPPPRPPSSYKPPAFISWVSSAIEGGGAGL